ncbi:hypothetical protein HPB51_013006 [Rhipicephalus microplus]|uniref:Uncharacterized protein n=1 Tax=Rhipicephalus microplus TaxID=6941 RepID=A0A9J6F2V7_RHIMP|nr:hypothetical protein HPB51_013006 [Rhipicephalus microplus]
MGDVRLPTSTVHLSHWPPRPLAWDEIHRDTGCSLLPTCPLPYIEVRWGTSSMSHRSPPARQQVTRPPSSLSNWRCHLTWARGVIGPVPVVAGGSRHDTPYGSTIPTVPSDTSKVSSDQYESFIRTPQLLDACTDTGRFPNDVSLEETKVLTPVEVMAIDGLSRQSDSPAGDTAFNRYSSNAGITSRPASK